MDDPNKWRELLGKIINDPQERQRIANEVGVSPITLTRWVSGESRPRSQNLRQLLSALPEQRQAFLELLPKEFEKFMTESADADDVIQGIPSTFYARVLHDHCTLPKALHMSSLCDLILLQALTQLDPNRVGLEITVVRCMHPDSNDKVRSLYECMGRGTAMLDRELEQKGLFLGAESLAGYVVSTGHYRVIHSREEGYHPFPAHWMGWEQSAIAYPIMRANLIAGCLLASSTQPHYFLASRQALLQNYTELLSLAFEAEAFYELRNIELGMIPPYNVQLPYISSFRKRVANTMIEATKKQQPLTLSQAELHVWSQLEEELLQLIHT